MSLETKGTIKYNPDVKASDPKFIIQAKQLGICVEGSGNLDQMMSELTERIRRGISEEFGIPRCDVVLTKYSINLTFDVSAPVNRTLLEFGAKPEPEDVFALEQKIKAYAERTGQDPEAVLDKLMAERDRRQQTILQKTADAVNAGALDGKGYTCTVEVKDDVPKGKKGKGVKA